MWIKSTSRSIFGGLKVRPRRRRGVKRARAWRQPAQTQPSLWPTACSIRQAALRQAVQQFRGADYAILRQLHRISKAKSKHGPLRPEYRPVPTTGSQRPCTGSQDPVRHRYHPRRSASCLQRKASEYVVLSPPHSRSKATAEAGASDREQPSAPISVPFHPVASSISGSGGLFDGESREFIWVMNEFHALLLQLGAEAVA